MMAALRNSGGMLRSRMVNHQISVEPGPWGRRKLNCVPLEAIHRFGKMLGWPRLSTVPAGIEWLLRSASLLRCHPFRPGAVGPQLSVLADVCVSVCEAGWFVPDDAPTEVHRKIQRIASTDRAARGARALVPVLAVVLFQHAGRTEGVIGSHDGGLAQLWRHVAIEDSEPPDLRRARPVGQA